MAEHTELWQAVLKKALLGTGRQPVEFPAGEGVLGDLVGRLDGAADPEGALLAVAGVLAVYQGAGQDAARGTVSPPEPCPEEEMPQCSEAAGARLAVMLNGTHRELLPEWLTAAAAVRLRAPERRLPELLDQAAGERKLRRAILPVLGKRGRWLANLNPAWQFLSTGDEGSEWDTGSKDVRLAVLQEVRGQEPARAREMVQETWKQEVASERAAFLAALETGLSIEDEPFLEECLDDRSQEVRKVAVDLLAHVPESRLCQRMIQRLQPLLTFAPAEKGRFLGLARGKPAQLHVTLPETCSKEMIRDGIAAKPPAAEGGIGKKAWWLREMLGAAPPSRWSHEWHSSPGEIVSAAAGSEWNYPLLEGFSTAAARQGDAGWAEALLDGWLNLPVDEGDAKDARWQQMHLTMQGRLLAVLPPARQHHWILNLARTSETCLFCDNALLLSLLDVTEGEWPLEMAREILDGARSHVKHAREYEFNGHRFQELAPHFPASMVSEFTEGWPTEAPAWRYWEKGVNEGAALIQFRADMLRELKAD